MAARRLAVPLLALLVGLQTPNAAMVFQPGASQRAVVVLGDLHMGVGRDQSGAWHAYEDFRWAAELAAFLDAIDTQGRGATDLILNGDTFELWQSTQKDCVYADADLGCTEPEALARIERVLAAHDAEITALGRFARSGSNRVVLVPGDHDAALLFPSVGRRVVGALGAPSGRVEVAVSGYWLSADGQIYAEHGHQIGFSAFRFDNWPAPFVRRAGREHLVRSWGEQVVQDVYNRYEERYPILDNVAASGAGVKYGLAAEGTADAGENAPRLLRYFLFTMTWLQFRLDLDGGDTQPPVWDLAKVRAEGPAALVSAVPDDDRFKPLAAKALTDGRLAALMDQFTDDELRAVCDYRAAVRRARRRLESVPTQLSGRGAVVTECPRTPETRGSAFEYFWQSRDLTFTRRLDDLRKRLPPNDRPIAVLVHGHTHLPDRSQAGFNTINAAQILAPEGFAPVRHTTTPVAINGGAWQRTITPVDLDRIKAERGVSDQDLLRSMQPEQLAPCYSFVQIGPYTGTPAPSVRYWRQAGNGGGALVTGCGR